MGRNGECGVDEFLGKSSAGSNGERAAKEMSM
jgi:hypothetical protein